MFIFTCAIVWMGTTITNAKSIVPKSNFFILLPPSPPFSIPATGLSAYAPNIANILVWATGKGYLLIRNLSLPMVFAAIVITVTMFVIAATVLIMAATAVVADDAAGPPYSLRPTSSMPSPIPLNH